MRQSNLELLRIVSMLLVLLAHYVATRDAVTVQSARLSPLPTFLNLELHSLSFVCVNCFILISGYFGIKFHLRSFCNFLFQIIFWNVVCIGLDKLFCISGESYSLLGMFFNGLIWGWFPQAYIVLFVLSEPLNHFISSVSVRNLGLYVLAFYVLSTICGYIFSFPDFRKGMSALSLVGVYLTGAYLRRTDMKIFRLNAHWDLLIYLVAGICFAAGSYILLRLGINKSPYGYLNPIIIMMAMYLFLFFSKVNIGSSAIINSLASSAFAVYLLHCHPCIGTWVSSFWTQINHHSGVATSLLIAIISFVLMYLFCWFIDSARITLFRRCAGIMHK